MSNSVPMTLAIFQQIGWVEMLIILAVGVLLFGRRLPEVGKNVGRGIVEFKKGIKGIQDEIEDQSRDPRDAPRNQQAYAPRPPLGPGGDDPRVSQGEASPVSASVAESSAQGDAKPVS